MEKGAALTSCSVVCHKESTPCCQILRLSQCSSASSSPLFCWSQKSSLPRLLSDTLPKVEKSMKIIQFNKLPASDSFFHTQDFCSMAVTAPILAGGDLHRLQSQPRDQWMCFCKPGCRTKRPQKRHFLEGEKIRVFSMGCLCFRVMAFDSATIISGSLNSQTAKRLHHQKHLADSAKERRRCRISVPVRTNAEL